MPITPHFDLNQTETHIELSIRVPHVRVTAESIEVLVDDDHALHFSSPPYLLVLRFGPHRFHPTAAEACAKYEPTIENGTVFLSLKKEQAGSWEDLDLLGKWTKPNTKEIPVGVRWLQEVQENDAPASNANTGESIIQEEDDTPNQTLGTGYGFLRLYHGIFADLTRDGLAKEMLEMPWWDDVVSPKTARVLPVEQAAPANNVRQQRRQQRLHMELDKFDAERYLQDLDMEEDYVYQCAMSHPAHWCKATENDDLMDQLANLSLQDKADDSFFSNEERQQLMKIPYPILPDTRDYEEGLVAGLIDILFAYVYDHLTTSGEPSVESAWTVSTLSATLSCLEDWLAESGSECERLAQVCHTCIRRSLVYPYLRNFDFACNCLEQVRLILQQGVRCVIRCLLQLRKIVDVSELYYLGNKIWLDPYLVWLQGNTQRVESVLHLQLKKWPPCSKENVNLYLVELESRFAPSSPVVSGANSQDSQEDDSSSSGESDSDSDDDTTSSTDESSLPAKETPICHTTDTALLDENLGQSILHVSSTEARPGTMKIDGTTGRSTSKLIEEIE